MRRKPSFCRLLVLLLLLLLLLLLPFLRLLLLMLLQLLLLPSEFLVGVGCMGVAVIVGATCCSWCDVWCFSRCGAMFLFFCSEVMPVLDLLVSSLDIVIVVGNRVVVFAFLIVTAAIEIHGELANYEV